MTPNIIFVQDGEGEWKVAVLNPGAKWGGGLCYQTVGKAGDVYKFHALLARVSTLIFGTPDRVQDLDTGRVREIMETLSPEYECEVCGRKHGNEFSRTCRECDERRESGDLNLKD